MDNYRPALKVSNTALHQPKWHLKKQKNKKTKYVKVNMIKCAFLKYEGKANSMFKSEFLFIMRIGFCLKRTGKNEA